MLFIAYTFAHLHNLYYKTAKVDTASLI